MNDELQGSDLPPSGGDAPPPSGSTIEILEQSAERLVLFIPAGPKRGSTQGTVTRPASRRAMENASP